MREGQTQERRAGQQNRLPQKDVGTRRQLCRPPHPSLCEDLLWTLSLKRRSARMAERGAAGLQGDQGERGGEEGDTGLPGYLLFSGSRRSGRGTSRARCAGAAPADNCCRPRSPNLQRAEGFRRLTFV